MVKSLLLSPVVLVALFGWLVGASFVLWATPLWEATVTGKSGWSMSVAEAVFWLHICAFMSCAVISTAKSAANLVHGERLPPNLIAIALSLPGVIALAYGFWMLLNVQKYSAPAFIHLPSN